MSENLIEPLMLSDPRDNVADSAADLAKGLFSDYKRFHRLCLLQWMATLVHSAHGVSPGAGSSFSIGDTRGSLGEKCSVGAGLLPP